MALADDELLDAENITIEMNRERYFNIKLYRRKEVTNTIQKLTTRETITNASTKWIGSEPHGLYDRENVEIIKKMVKWYRINRDQSRIKAKRKQQQENN